MGWVRRAGILLTVCVIALGSGGAAVGAMKKKRTGWASHVTLTHPLANQFKGTVTSKLGACRGARVVTLYYTDPNTGITSPLSVQRTAGKGGYQVLLAKDAFSGTYHAQVAKRKVRARGAKQTCKAAESPAIVVG